ncbi:MAG: hypothetical protein CSA54_02720 [Gammaproteobacteria bacterium]|nr:MAG: hypothetical protein CSA54_02720 [Gammaproteobacteria bacterium]
MFLIQALTDTIQNTDNTSFWMVTALVLLGCLVSLTLWFKKTKRARLIEDVPTSSIRSAAQGYVELIGNAGFLPDDKIVSPLSGRACVWFSYTVEKYQSSNNNRSNWKVVDDVTSDQLFVLEDDTGRCVVDPYGAEIETWESQRWYGKSRHPGSAPKKTSLLDSVNADYRYTERWIEPAEILYAIGHFETEGTGEELPSLRDEVRQLLTLWKQQPERYLRPFDKNHDGKIDEQEWAEVRRAAKQEAQHKRMEMAGSPQVHLIRKPQQKSDIYILSSLTDEELVKKYRKRSRWLLIYSILSAITLVWMLNVRF